MRSCSDCRYAEAAEGVLECHRRAPSPYPSWYLPGPAPHGTTLWPRVCVLSDWCGEWAAVEPDPLEVEIAQLRADVRALEGAVARLDRRRLRAEAALAEKEGGR